MAQLVVRSTKMTITVPINSKFTILRGDSAIGKTSLVRTMKSRASTISCDYPIYYLADTNVIIPSVLNELYKAKGVCLVIGDENIPYLHSERFQKIMLESPHLFLLISRDNFNSLPYSYSDIVTLETRGKKSIGVPMLNPTTEARFRNIKQVYVEDSKSGYSFFKSFFDKSPVEVHSANGKSNLVNLVKTLGNTLFIADGLGIGPEIEELVGILNRIPNCNTLMLIESFEALVYKSDFCNGEEVPEITCPNREKFYEEALTNLFREHGLKYTKSKLLDCLVVHCCPHRRCKLYTREDKYKLILGSSYTKLLKVKENGE